LHSEKHEEGFDHFLLFHHPFFHFRMPQPRRAKRNSAGNKIAFYHIAFANNNYSRGTKPVIQQ